MVNLRCQIAHLIEHILNKYPVARGGITDQHVGNSTDQIAVPDDGAARQVCGQEGTTLFINSFVSLGIAS